VNKVKRGVNERLTIGQERADGQRPTGDDYAPFVPTELERTLAFEEVLRTRCAERIVPFRFGRAYFNDSHPRVWYLNGLVVEGTKDVDPGELAAEAELLHTDAGQAHRRCDVLDEAVGARLERFFRRIGWRIEQELVMAYRGGGDRIVDISAVEEVAGEDLLPLRREIDRAEPWATDEEIVDEILDANRLWQAAGNARYFTVRVDGAPVAAADLYSDGRVAQVETVATLPAYRDRGYASAVVLRAVEVAQSAGHDLVFIEADAGDWPKELYARLGFEEIGRTWSFLRTPAQVPLT
jgi:ribosomal protein S18 acetylase RimI-like enzyme